MKANAVAQPGPQSDKAKMTWDRRWKIVKKNRTLIYMSLPAIIFFFVFSYIPMPGMYVAFVDYHYNTGIYGSPFVGFKNFEFLTLSGDLARITWNTLYYNILFIATSTIAQIALAVMLNEIINKTFKKVTQTIMFLPYFVSWVIVGLFLYGFIQSPTGMINSMLVGMGYKAVDFYSIPAYWPFILTFINLWKGAGYGSIVYLAVITGLDPEVMEAASIDGANEWQRIKYIILPGLRATFVILTLFAIGGILKGNFGLFYNTVGAFNTALYKSTDIIETYIFRGLMANFNFSISSAAGVYQSVFGLLIVLAANWAVNKIEPDYALF